MGQKRQLPKDGRYLYLDRYDHDWDYFDHQLRPARTPEAHSRSVKKGRSTDFLGSCQKVGSVLHQSPKLAVYTAYFRLYTRYSPCLLGGYTISTTYHQSQNKPLRVALLRRWVEDEILGTLDVRTPAEKSSLKGLRLFAVV